MKIARWLAGGGLLGRETGDPRNTDSPFYPIFQRFHLDLLAFGEKAREYTHTTLWYWFHGFLCSRCGNLRVRRMSVEGRGTSTHTHKNGSQIYNQLFSEIMPTMQTTNRKIPLYTKNRLIRATGRGCSQRWANSVTIAVFKHWKYIKYQHCHWHHVSQSSTKQRSPRHPRGGHAPRNRR